MALPFIVTCPICSHQWPLHGESDLDRHFVYAELVWLSLGCPSCDHSQIIYGEKDDKDDR